MREWVRDWEDERVHERTNERTNEHIYTMYECNVEYEDDG